MAGLHGAIGANDERTSDGYSTSEHRDSTADWLPGRLSRMDFDRHAHEARPVPVPTPDVAPVEEVLIEPAIPFTEIEAAICAVFGAYCRDALAVAACESGLDYWAGVGVHAGTFQLSVRYHAVRFANRGWDVWVDGSDYYRNSVVAFELFSERGFSWLGTSGWPHCGWEAGY